MNRPIRFVVSLTIQDGKFDAFETGARAYEFYLSADKKRCRLFEEYRDSAAAFAHLSGRVVTELVPQVLALADLDAFEVYGDAGPDVMAILQGVGASAFDFWHGL